ncbi:hypothetical protein HOP50_01g01550 [Chloropicon primus]|uniref:Uncharacterized protein n=1 Tax=Chloropicon primus TaxID=1764295 RepID=A0A5B8MB17_9CHLO|nr:hypothetical protein A3770_01p01660 [Chloropicon primus]UPQ96864.1 hypothetical protein HOP50_01g01550 [Chloropicon primus]|eukprot:QDZ17648.1 hypothetical protein A3770_01p01660 [Chloropicon primus]
MGGGAAGRTFSQIWLSDKATYPLIITMTAGMALLGFRLVHSSTAPEVTFSKKNRGNFEHWTDNDGKDASAQGERFRKHPIRNFFGTVKPSIMPDLNEYMSKSS